MRNLPGRRLALTSRYHPMRPRKSASRQKESASNALMAPSIGPQRLALQARGFRGLDDLRHVPGGERDAPWRCAERALLTQTALQSARMQEQNGFYDGIGTFACDDRLH